MTAIIASNLAQDATACSYPKPLDFRQSIEKASSVLIFRLEAAELRRSGTESAYSEWIEGRIRVIEALKGDASSFKILKFSSDRCGGLRLDVGHYFLVATNERGATIDFDPDDHSVLDISDYYSEEDPALSAQGRVLRPIYEFLEQGKPLPVDYPPLVLRNLTSTSPFPD
jgi:hypothetical protein